MSDTHSNGRPYFRTPNISPDSKQIAFVYAADIWLVSIEGGEAERLTANPSSHSSPRWSPDASQIAFSSNRTGQGDVYILPLAAGDVQRITYHDSASAIEAWSPDGAQLFISSGREQQGGAIFRVPTAGGTPIPWITQPYQMLNSLSVAPDGGMLAFNITHDRWWRRGPNPYGGAEIWTVSNAADATNYRKLSDYAGMNRWPMWAPDGQGLYFISDRDGMENLWFQPLEGGPARQLTGFGEGRMLWPSISGDGQTIVFERDFGIWRMDVRSGEIAPLSIHVRPDTKITPVRVFTYNRELTELELSPDGKKVAFVVRGEIFADFADKETDKEQRQGPSFRVTNTSFRESDVVWSPDSRRLAFTSDRHGDTELFLYDFASRSEIRPAQSNERAPGPVASPAYSPDGKWIAYGSAHDQIRLLDTETNADRAFVRANFAYSASFAWSPDSQWLVFVGQDERFFSNLYVQRINAQEARQITFLSNQNANRPLWSPNGRFVIFTTGQYRAESQIARVELRPRAPQFREAEFEKLFDIKAAAPAEKPQPAVAKEKATEQPNEQPSEAADQQQSEPAEKPEAPAPATDSRSSTPAIEIVFEGIERRLRLLTPTQMGARAQSISPDSRDLLFHATVAGKTNLWTQPLDEPRQEQAARQITSSSGDKWAAQFAPDGKSIYFLDNGQIIVRKFPTGDQTQLPVSAEISIDFNQEKAQVFDESWRLLRDYFYDPTFRGLDWSAARAQFAPVAAGAQTLEDLRDVLNLMVGELRASHLGAAMWLGSVQHGYIGLVFDSREQAATGRMLITNIVPDSPAALAGDGDPIKIGDELLAIDGVALGPAENMDILLQRTIGRRVRLRIGLSAGGEPRELAVRPISAGHYDSLRYRGWVYANEAYVHRISKGRLGYVHIRAMTYDAYQQFLSDLDAETYSKEGVVIDARFNGGGHTGTFILDVLARRSTLLSTFRDRPPTNADHMNGNRVLNKPTVLVINEHSGSNTEMFAESYRRLGLGAVVGRPSAGAVIGTYERRLLNGLSFRLPRVKIATPEGEDLEGTGRAVDVDMALPMGDSARNIDRQLDAAVADLLGRIDRNLISNDRDRQLFGF